MKMLEPRRSIQCDWVVPLSIQQSQAESIFRQWLGRGFWRPSDAVRVVRLGKVAPVYLPFWVFEAMTDTKWTADSSPVPAGCRGDWYPLASENRGHHRDILIGASSILTPDEVQAVAPFDLLQSVEPQQVDLKNSIVEIFKLPRKSARPLAQAVIEQRERLACSRYIAGRSRRIKVNVRIHGMSGRPFLLPVWIMAYSYQNQIHRVLINGQTGKIAGTAPFSYGKLLLLLAVGLGLMFFLILAGLVANSG
jgi:hypothetical protein